MDISILNQMTFPTKQSTQTSSHQDPRVTSMHVGELNQLNHPDGSRALVLNFFFMGENNDLCLISSPKCIFLGGAKGRYLTMGKVEMSLKVFGVSGWQVDC